MRQRDSLAKIPIYNLLRRFKMRLKHDQTRMDHDWPDVSILVAMMDMFSLSIIVFSTGITPDAIDSQLKY